MIPKLKIHFEDCFHVDYIGLTIPAKDSEIWNFALINHLVIVTNDDDFLNLANNKGVPPNVVLLRTGNQHNNYLMGLLIKHKDDISALVASSEYGFLEIF